MRLRPLVLVLSVCVALWAAPAALGVVVTYPSSETIPASGKLPTGGSELRFNTAIGEREGGFVVVTGASRVGATVDSTGLGPIEARLFFAHFVAFGSRLVPDALLPWDGSPRAAEQPNQPLYLQVLVPNGTAPGTYAGSLTVTADGEPIAVPLAVRVLPVVLPEPGKAAGSLLTSFHLSPETYVKTAAGLYGHGNTERQEANAALFAFLAGYRISPASWGFGEPKSPSGYSESRKWWLDSAGNMAKQVAAGPGFAAMRLPISNNRTSPRNYIAGLSPFEPERWCDYLGSVRSFWEARGWLDAVPYLYGLDEPGPEGQRLVARQAAVAHRCFSGAKVLMTGNPSPNGANDFLLDGNDDDLDAWVVLARRFYGSFTTPGREEAGENRSRLNLRAIERARARGKQIWAYTYTAVPGTPGFLATEPLSNPRMFMLWAALEGLQGVLYGQGTTNYGQENPLERVGQDGEFVLLYPGPSGPIASARLEQIRDGIEDWAIYDIVRRKRGPTQVRAILGGQGLFSADRSGVKLACTAFCDLEGETKYSWPRWSQDASTPERIEAAKLQALRLAAG